VESARSESLCRARQERVDSTPSSGVGNIFLAGREKNEPGSDFSGKEVEAAKIVAKGLQAADLDKLNLNESRWLPQRDMRWQRRSEIGLIECSRVARTAEDLSAYGLVSKTDMARMRVLCEEPPVYTPERVVAIRTNIAKPSQAVFASLLNVSVSTVQKWSLPLQTNTRAAPRQATSARRDKRRRGAHPVKSEDLRRQTDVRSLLLSAESACMRSELARLLEAIDLPRKSTETNGERTMRQARTSITLSGSQRC